MRKVGGYCLGLVVTILSTASCAPAPDRAAHTVEEYGKDARLRANEMKVCANDPGTLGAHRPTASMRVKPSAARVSDRFGPCRRLNLPDKTVRNEPMGFFATFSTWLDGMLVTYIGTNTAKIATLITPAIATLATVYVMVWGYLQLTGKIEEPFVTGIKRIILLSRDLRRGA